MCDNQRIIRVIYQKFTEQLAEAGRTVTGCTDALGMNRTAFYDMIKGERPATAYRIYQLAQWLGCRCADISDIDEVFRYTEGKEGITILGLTELGRKLADPRYRKTQEMEDHLYFVYRAALRLRRINEENGKLLQDLITYLQREAERYGISLSRLPIREEADRNRHRKKHRDA